MNLKKQHPIKMLGLKLPTDPRWVNIVEKNIEEILTDHAYCEQKATSTAISLIVSFPEYTELVQEMVALVKEEISHFKLVHDKIIARGWTLGRDRKDRYVLEILKLLYNTICQTNFWNIYVFCFCPLHGRKIYTCGRNNNICSIWIHFQIENTLVVIILFYFLIKAR